MISRTQGDIKTYFEQNGSKTTWEDLAICFNKENYWNCYAIDYSGHGNGFGRFKYDWALLTDASKLENCVREIVKTIYGWRSKFVHDVHCLQ